MTTLPDAAADPVLRAFQDAPLAPEEDRLTPEQLADLEARLAFSEAHPEFSFTWEEVFARIIQRWRDAGQGGGSVRRDVDAYCAERGITLDELCAQVEAKNAAAKVAWEAWCAERGIEPYPKVWPRADEAPELAGEEPVDSAGT